jgi:hypothetical protein
MRTSSGLTVNLALTRQGIHRRVTDIHSCSAPLQSAHAAADSGIDSSAEHYGGPWREQAPSPSWPSRASPPATPPDASGSPGDAVYENDSPENELMIRSVASHRDG